MKDFDWVLGKSRGKGRLIIDHLPLEQAFDCLYVTSYVENVGCSYGLPLHFVYYEPGKKGNRC